MKLGHRYYIAAAGLAAVLGAGFAPAQQGERAAADAPAKPAAADMPAKPASEESASRLVRNGVVVDFTIQPAEGGKELIADQLADVRFTIKNEASGEPLRAANPGAWMDMSQVLQGRPGAEQKSCKDKVSLYLQGAVGMRPMADLNSYFVVVLNADPSLSVVDPLVSMAGRTSTMAKIMLPGSGADWAQTPDQKRIFVSAPRVGKVAVVDAEGFKLAATIDAGKEPTRVVMQPDGKFLWVGNDGKGAGESGVTVINAETNAVVARMATGKGHHEIAFTDDSRTAFVSNRDDGTVTVIDVPTRTRNRDLKTGPLPISIAFSSLAKALYVADGKDGTVTAYDATTFEPRRKIALKPGLGPMRFTSDGRYGLVVNPSQDALYVIDASGNELVNTVTVKGEPFQIMLSPTFAYVRSLKSERVSMIALRTLGKGSTPTVQSFAAGSQPPRAGGELVIASSMAASSKEAATFVVNPADNTVYFYMEGMNSPSSNYQVRGASARAVTIVDRSLKEVEPGVYAGKVTLPAPGHYDVAFMMQSPQLLHCFSAEVKPNPKAPKSDVPFRVKFDESQRTVKAAEPLKLRFTVVDAETGKPKAGLGDLRVMYYLSPGRNRTEVPARDLGDGNYEAELAIGEPGAYYAYVGAPSLKLGYGKLPYFSLRAVKELPPAPSEKKG